MCFWFVFRDSSLRWAVPLGVRMFLVAPTTYFVLVPLPQRPEYIRARVWRESSPPVPRPPSPRLRSVVFLIFTRMYAWPFHRGSFWTSPFSPEPAHHLHRRQSTLKTLHPTVQSNAHLASSIVVHVSSRDRRETRLWTAGWTRPRRSCRWRARTGSRRW